MCIHVYICISGSRWRESLAVSAPVVLCVCVRVCVCIFRNMRKCVRVYICMCVYTCVYVYPKDDGAFHPLHQRPYADVCVYVCVYMYILVCVHSYIRAYMCKCVYIISGSRPVASPLMIFECVCCINVYARICVYTYRCIIVYSCLCIYVHTCVFEFHWLASRAASAPVFICACV